MYVNVDVYDTVEGDVTINNEFKEKLEDKLGFFIEKFIENKEDKEEYQNAVDKIMNLLQKAGNKYELTDVDCYVDSVEVDDDNLPIKDNYDDGYDAAKEEMEKAIDHVKSCKSPLIMKIERKAFNYGKQEEITREDCRELIDLIEAGYF